MSVGVEEIDGLGLGEAFPGKDGFANLENCWLCTQDSKVIVIDDVDGCRFSDNLTIDRDQGFLLINGDNHNVILLAIDKKLIDNHPGGIADCAVFDLAQFLFVEFKSNALGNSVESVKDTFDKAVSQLEETLRVFKERDPQVFESRQVMCYIITSHSFPRFSTTKQKYIYKFAEDNDILELSFNTQHVFS